MSAKVTCPDCKHYDLDEAELPCRSCEGLDHFEAPASTTEVDQLRAEVERLTAENSKMSKALEQITEHLKLPCDKRDDGILEQIAAEAVRHE